MIDAADRKLLNLIQRNFPLVPEPYRELARMLGVSEENILERLERLKREGIIRRLGGFFESRKLGYCGTLCALKVPPERIEEVAAFINRYPGVTHNYLRDYKYNMWFTLLAESTEKLEQIIREIKDAIKIQDFLELPAVKIFKINVNFELTEE